jgi:hypothetical protein
MVDVIRWQESGSSIKAYYIIVIFSFIYILFKYRKHSFSALIILFFFSGLFSFYGKSLQNAYRIILLILTLYWLLRTKPFKNSHSNRIIISFIFLTITFLFTSYRNGDYLFIIFSQYSRYFILFSMFFILKKYSNDNLFRNRLEKIIYDLLLIQIILSIFKLIIIGPIESIVGSVASQGGAIATSVPMLGFMFIWVKKKGRLEQNDWVFIIGLIFIGFLSVKRAIWFMMPVIVSLLMFYVPKRRVPNKVILYSVLAVPLIFYLGVRLNPSLNREEKIWGSFDPEYAINYAQVYSFGEKDQKEKGTGRGGATLLLFNKFINSDINDKEWTGYGLRFIYATNYTEFNELNLGINHLGSATGAFQTMVSNGYLGILALVWFITSMLLRAPNKRLRIVLIFFFCWEYFFYTGILIRELSLSFMLIYIVLFSGTIVSEANPVPAKTEFA